MDLSQVLLLFGGQSIILIGLCSWLGKVSLNRILTSEQASVQKKIAAIRSEFEAKLVALSAGNESKVHVGKIQYEREYASYAEIWDLTSPLTHHLQLLFVHKHSYEFFKEAFYKLGDYKINLGSKVNTLYPFIDEDVYKKGSICPQILQKYWADFDQHLTYLEGKANQSLPQSKKLEIDFGSLITEVTAEIHTTGVELARSIRSRNQEVIIIANTI
ncbi:hypothetical protein GCM10007978_32310 [Shewanella hanedai]|uniref:Uncharacterized protein n=1 Tax=Shewanella hanedai TaxID=25 RepID=A0A553JKE5_SHEHA|nr:hypothetical protein [Shewanella hanedai]TRY12927.1 hypothetical protein FN961_18430 [Shewanella hanedai]GGI92322.1 hypothetical protein GCM10007978_32310 [Shewanella hanedai]